MRGGAGERAQEGILDALAADRLALYRLGAEAGPGGQVEGAQGEPGAQAATLELSAQAAAIGDAACEADRRRVEAIGAQDDRSGGVQDLDRGPRPASQVDGWHEGHPGRAGRVLEDEARGQDLEVGDLGQGGEDLVSLLLDGIRAPGEASVHVTDGHGAVVGAV